MWVLLLVVTMGSNVCSQQAVLSWFRQFLFSSHYITAMLLMSPSAVTLLKMLPLRNWSFKWGVLVVFNSSSYSKDVIHPGKASTFWQNSNFVCLSMWGLLWLMTLNLSVLPVAVAFKLNAYLPLRDVLCTSINRL